MSQSSAADFEEEIIRDFSYSKSDMLQAHSATLADLTNKAKASKLYREVENVTDISQIEELPLTSYDKIQNAISAAGLGKVLLQPFRRWWQTSGYTGAPKRFYYGEKDIETFTRLGSELAYMIGVRAGTSAWCFGAQEPFMAGDFFELISNRLGVNLVNTRIHNEMDFIKGLKQVSKLDKVQILIGPPLLYLLISRIVEDPQESRRFIKERIKSQHVPSGLASLITSIFLYGLKFRNLRNIVENAEMCCSYGEALAPYLPRLRVNYPKANFFDLLGSTEQIMQAAQVQSEREGLSFVLNNVIPEIADPEEIIKAKQDPDYRIESVPWYKWEKSMKGELIITRPGQCLPLIRYLTGDLIEVLDPFHSVEAQLEYNSFHFKAPLIKVLGRSVDLVDFEAPDDMGNILSQKLYSREVQDALRKTSNIRWWELYSVEESLDRLTLLVIPEREVADKEQFGKEIAESLLNEIEDLAQKMVARAYVLGERSENIIGKGRLLDVVVTEPSAYKQIEKEIEKRTREGRPLGQLKPKHIYKVQSEKELRELVGKKKQ